MTISSVRNFRTLNDNGRIMLQIPLTFNEENGCLEPDVTEVTEGISIYTLKNCNLDTIQSDVHWKRLVDNGLVVWVTKDNDLKSYDELTTEGEGSGYQLETDNGEKIPLKFRSIQSVTDPLRIKGEKEYLMQFAKVFKRQASTEAEAKVKDSQSKVTVIDLTKVTTESKENKDSKAHSKDSPTKAAPKGLFSRLFGSKKAT